MKRLREFEADQVELERKIEELRHSQRALEASRNQYEQLYNFAPVAYFTFERDGKIRTVNRTGLRLFGLEHPDLVGRRFDNFVAARERLTFLDYLGTVFKSLARKTCRVELAVPGKDPLWVRIEAMVTESRDECLAVLVDITEKRLAEEALSESEYNLAKAQAMTHVGSWSFDPGSSEIKASDELLSMMRLTRGEATQVTFAAAVHPEDRVKVIEHLRMGIDNGTSYEIEHRLLLPDGSCRWVYSMVEPLVDEAGRVVRVYGTTQDITERKEAEVELSNKTNELQAIFDSISDGIVVFDQNGRLQHHNQISPQLLPDGAVVPGTECGAVFQHQYSQAQRCPVERALDGERVETSLVFAQEGRPPLYLDITATPIKGAPGKKNRALVFCRDVSDKRLQEMRLIQAEKMSSIGVLATGIAHEINNPLASVAGCAEALQRRFRDHPELKSDERLDVFPNYLEVITRESYRCKGIIDNLLSFGRKSEGLLVNVDMNAILLEIVELIGHQRNYQQVRLKTALQDSLPCVDGDPSTLRQVCMNLLINAHQSINGEGVVEVISKGPERGMITITVRDTGCGISKENIDRIWDPFFTTKEAGKGTGLGLALSYSIVKRHAGEIRVESAPGKGTTFTVLLPVSRR